MAKSYNVRTGGDPSVTIGVKNINSFNVKPTDVVTSTAPGTLIDLPDLNNYEMFTVTSGGVAEAIKLPTAAAVGTVVVVKIGGTAGRAYPEASSGVGINGGTDAQYVVLAANSTTKFLRTSATTWIATQFAPAGTVSAPVPA